MVLIFREEELGIDGSGTVSFGTVIGSRSSATPAHRSVKAARAVGFRVRGFFHGIQSSSHSNFSRNTWCLRCNRNQFSNCAQDRNCFACDKIRHMKKDWTKLQTNQGMGRGNGRLTAGIASPNGEPYNSRRATNTPNPATTQSSVHQPRA